MTTASVVSASDPERSPRSTREVPLTALGATPARASRSRSSVTRVAGASAVARRRENPARMRPRPTLAAMETARSKLGDPARPSTSARLSRNTVAEDRRVDSSWRIMSCPLRATLGQWIRRRSSPVTYSRIV